MRENALGFALHWFLKLTHEFEPNHPDVDMLIMCARRDSGLCWLDLLGPLDDECALECELGSSLQPNISPYAIAQMCLRHIDSLRARDLAYASCLHHARMILQPDNAFGWAIYNLRRAETEKQRRRAQVEMEANGIQLYAAPLEPAKSHERRQAIIKSLVGVSL